MGKRAVVKKKAIVTKSDAAIVTKSDAAIVTKCDATIVTKSAGESLQHALSVKHLDKHRTYALIIGYIGSDFHGIQKQSNTSLRTVESVLEQGLIEGGCLDLTIASSRKHLNWSRAARTDKGVHAVVNVVVCNLKKPVSEEINTRLGKEKIIVYFSHRVVSNFDARVFCDRRRYEYFIPSVHVSNISEFSKIMQIFVGTHSFHNFCTVTTAADDPKRFISKIDVEVVEDTLVKVILVGQSFLFNQIRKIISGALECSWKKVTLPDLRELLKPGKTRKIHMAPAEGLLLDRLFFDSYDSSKCNYKDILPLGWGFKDNQIAIDNFKRDMIIPEIKSKLFTVFDDWIKRG